MDMTVIGIILVTLVIFMALIYTMVNLYRKCGPSQALIITGAVPGGVQIVREGGMVVFPLINQVHTISLAVMTVKLDSDPGMLDRNKVPVHMSGTAHVKVRHEDEAIRKAAERFVGKSEGEITKVAQEILSGHLVAVVATMSAVEIKQCLDPLAQRVREMSFSDLDKMGLEAESLSLR